MDSCHRGAGRRGPVRGGNTNIVSASARRHEPVMNMCHFTRRALGGLAAQPWKIECLGLMILKMIESRLEMASPARPEEMETYLTAFFCAAPTCPPPPTSCMGSPCRPQPWACQSLPGVTHTHRGGHTCGQRWQGWHTLDCDITHTQTHTEP